VTRKTRLSALATAFGLTLTLGLALPIMATVTYTWHECTFSVKAWYESSTKIAHAQIFENDAQCASGKNVRMKVHISSDNGDNWTYMGAYKGNSSVAMGWVNRPTGTMVEAAGSALTGIYPWTWMPWSPYVS